VEAELLNGVVCRFESGVKTQSLRQVVVEDEAHRRVFLGMKKSSEWSGHDRAAAKQCSLPDHVTGARDLEDLKSYAASLKKRKSQIEEQRKKLEEPPKGTLT
jgi:hypothetical protein